MKYEVKPTGAFKKDLKQVQKQGKKIEKLYQVISKLANGEPLEKRYCDHALTGNYQGARECHIEPDWLLVYKVYEDVLVLALTRTGSHSEIFSK
jgi:mRNA interferase YafQ